MGDLRPINLRRATCRSPRSCCRRLGGRPRRLRLRCREAQQKTRRRHFCPTVCGRVNRVSPLSPIVPTNRENGMPQPSRVLLPTILDEFNDSVLEEPISYARIEQAPGSESPLSLPVYAWPPKPTFMMDPIIQTVLPPPPPEDRNAPSGDHMGCAPGYGRKGLDDRIRNTGLSIQILGVRRTPVYRWKPGIWLATPSPVLPRISGSPGVGTTIGPSTFILGGGNGYREGNGGGRYLTKRRRCYVVKPANIVPFRNGFE